MIFTIQTNDEVAGLDITNALSLAGIQHTILIKQNDEAARQTAQRADTPHEHLQAEFDYICAVCGERVNRRG